MYEWQIPCLFDWDLWKFSITSHEQRRVWTLRKFSACSRQAVIVHQIVERQQEIDVEEWQRLNITKCLAVDDSYVIILVKGSIENRSTESFDVIRTLSVEAEVIEYSNGYLMSRFTNTCPTSEY